MNLASLLSSLPVVALIAPALLTAGRLRLISLTSAFTDTFVCLPIDFAHVVAILDHVLAAKAALVVLNL